MLWGYLSCLETALIAICLSLSVSLVVYKKIIKPLDYWKCRNVAYKKPYPVVGSYGAFVMGRVHFSEICNGIYNKFPNERYVGMWNFTKPSLLLRDLELIKQICIKDFDHFSERQLVINEGDDSLIGRSLVSLSGKEWKEMRATLSPVFTSSKMKAMFPLMVKCAENLIEHFLNKTDSLIRFEAKEVYSRYTNDVVASTAFGIDVNSLEEPENPFYVMGRELTTTTFKRGVNAFFITMLPRIAKLFNIKIIPQHIEYFFREIVTKQMRDREEKNIIRPDLIHLLMEAKKGKLKHDSSNDATSGFATVDESDIGKSENLQIKELTDDDITAQALIFFFAGFDTASTASSFMSQELAMNPDIQERLQGEIDEELEKCNGKLGYDSVMSLKYLDQVISETLRLWPPGVQTDRHCLKEYNIKPLSENETPGVIVKSGSVVIPIMAIHRDPKYYENPTKFDPDRFSEENKNNIVPGSYLPFGVGPRNCIASRFGLLMTKVLFVNLLSKFNIEVTEDTEIPLKLTSKFNMTPEKGFNLGLRSRQK